MILHYMSVMKAPLSGGRSDRKAKGQGGERREEILAAAVKLFASEGVHAVSTRQIAQAVGVSQPTLYAYFPTKDAILDEACQMAFAQLGARVRQAVAQAAAGENEMAVIGREYIRFGLEQPDAYRIAFMMEGAQHMAPATPETMAGLSAFMVLRDHVARTFAVDEPTVDLISQSCWATMHGLVSLLIARPHFPWTDVDRLAEVQVDAACRAWSHMPRR